MEETKKTTESEKPKNRQSKIVLCNQNTLSLTGVNKVLSSTESEIDVEINGQVFCISGSKLAVNKVDVESGILEATGEVHQMKFSGHKHKENFFKRVFG